MITADTSAPSNADTVVADGPLVGLNAVPTVGFRFAIWITYLVLADATAAAVAAVALLLARFGTISTSGLYPALAAALVPAWLITLTLSGSYDARFIAAGAEQYRRIINGAAWLLAVIGFTAFVLQANVSRGLVIGSVPCIAVLTIAERYAARRWLHKRFARDWSAHRVMAIGSTAEVTDLVDHMHRAFHAGFRVVAALTPGEGSAPSLPQGVLWAGGQVTSVLSQVRVFGADTIAIAGTHVLERGGLRKLSWQLEDTDVNLMVAPAITDIAGPRIRIRPVEGLPLLHIDRPEFSGVRRLVKGSLDRVMALMLLVFLSPVFAAAAVAVKFSGRGPVLFHQTRVGFKGQSFTLFKFRSMRSGAEEDLTRLSHLNDHEGVLFKVRRDPRVTRTGRLLRRLSIDEIPQLWNVLRGDMSLVGPRPPLPSEVQRYGTDVHRRLLVKPGITGLWQVSGRSDLSWEETVRLDLHYVDHWSVGLDFVLMWKTVLTVIRGRGAY